MDDGLDGGLRAFLCYLLAFETGVTSESCGFDSVKLRYVEARKHGYSEDPFDRGGATMIGVTLKTYSAYCRRHGLREPSKLMLKNLPYEHWMGVVKELFWDYCKADQIVSDPVKWIVVDWVWGSGPKVIRNVQRVVNLFGHSLKVDGVIGRMTLESMNGIEPRLLFDAIKDVRRGYLESIVRRDASQERFIKGWLRRLDALCYDGLRY